MSNVHICRSTKTVHNIWASKYELLLLGLLLGLADVVEFGLFIILNGFKIRVGPDIRPVFGRSDRLTNSVSGAPDVLAGYSVSGRISIKLFVSSHILN